MHDRIIECAQCGEEFVFTKKEQEYYHKMGFDEPKRCVGCRRHKTKSESDADYKSNRVKRKLFRDRFEDGYQ